MANWKNIASYDAAFRTQVANRKYMCFSDWDHRDCEVLKSQFFGNAYVQHNFSPLASNSPAFQSSSQSSIDPNSDPSRAHEDWCLFHPVYAPDELKQVKVKYEFHFTFAATSASMWNKSILYTGDIQAEPWWIESLTKESILAPFLDFNHFNHLKDHHHHPRIRLDNIYLDTSALLYKKSVLTKEQAILSTLRFMSLYPSHTIFFINTWTWGWEGLLEQISIHFQTLIHVDQYKFDLYTLPSLRKHYPLLSNSITLDSKLTRFHACERKQRCVECQDERDQSLYTEEIEIQSKEKESFRRRVVTVNPMEINDQKWFRIEVQLQYEIDLAIDQEKINSSENDLWPSLIVRLHKTFIISRTSQIHLNFQT
ncbi:hypothetical protein DFH28DRAFT_1120585 [Melampsora americana]|nr:hypothetical protein DFH28DRAFT_1120585 [Melampsora americana]